MKWAVFLIRVHPCLSAAHIAFLENRIGRG
jgi:hypothetical protein